MNNKLLKEIEIQTSTIETENGAKVLESTLNAPVNLFGIIGAMREQSEEEILKTFDESWKENPELTLRMVFHARNVRGGMGERRTARVLFRHIAEIAPEAIKNNIVYIPFFGRWDDLYYLVGTSCEDEALALIKSQFRADMDAIDVFEKTGEHQECSLLGKWLKSVNSSSKETRALGRLTARTLGMRDKEYRASLARLRNYLGVIESKISRGEWKSINYAGVTSKAMTIYRNAFLRHDPEGFQEYLDSLKKGETKINSGTLFPYEILEQYHTYTGNRMIVCDDYDTVLEEQWKALPNYVDSDMNVLVMADTSGSMECAGGRPLYSSLGLAIYFAERNRGDFKDVFMTFDKTPSFVKLKGRSLKEKLENIKSINVANTNIEACFNLLLDTAVKGNVPKEDMPKALVIISDMQFDKASRDEFYHDLFAEKFAEAGYELPNIIYWNVNAACPVFHAVSDVKGVQMASGSSPSLFKSILDNLGKTPEEAVLSVLNSEVYSMITL